MDFPILDKRETRILEKMRFTNLPIGYKIVSYKESYSEDLRNCIYKSFANSTDTKYDPRFKTLKGVDDITHKITEEIYGRFLKDASKILLFENDLIGFCLANVTGSHIANICLTGILEEHRGLGLSEVMLKKTVEDVIKMNKQGDLDVDSFNVSADYDNSPAIKMYRQIGFKLSYTYNQGYLPSALV